MRLTSLGRRLHVHAGLHAVQEDQGHAAVKQVNCMQTAAVLQSNTAGEIMKTCS